MFSFPKSVGNWAYVFGIERSVNFLQTVTSAPGVSIVLHEKYCISLQNFFMVTRTALRGHQLIQFFKNVFFFFLRDIDRALRPVGVFERKWYIGHCTEAILTT